MKRLRGTWFDPFGYSAESKGEWAMIDEFEADLDLVACSQGAVPYGLLTELARVPDMVRGYGPEKDANVRRPRGSSEVAVAAG